MSACNLLVEVAPDPLRVGRGHGRVVGQGSVGSGQIAANRYKSSWASRCSSFNAKSSPLRKPRILLPQQATAERGFLSRKSPKNGTGPALRPLSQSIRASPWRWRPSRRRRPTHPKSANHSPPHPQAGTQLATTSPTPPRHQRRKCPQRTTQSGHPPRSRSHTPAKRRNVVRPAGQRDPLNPLAAKT